MVLHRRAAEHQAMPSAQEPRRLGGSSRGVLDGLSLVEHNVVEVDVLEPKDVAAQGAVSAEHEIVGGEVTAVAIEAAIVKHAQLRREARRLFFPVENERARNHNQGWPERLPRGS